MFGSDILEVAIGLVLLYAFLSLVCSAINEWIMRLQKQRPSLLKLQIHQMLGCALSSHFNKHPLIRGQFDNGQYPDYLPASIVAMALMEVGYTFESGKHGDPGTVAIRKEWMDSKDTAAKDLLEALRQDSTNLGSLQARIEKWFQLSMNQTTRLFKKKVTQYMLVISFAIVVLMSADSVKIALGLYDGATSDGPFTLSLFEPITFSFESLFGLFLSWAAVSLGAPFWFDILTRLSDLRQAVKLLSEKTSTQGESFVSQ